MLINYPSKSNSSINSLHYNIYSQNSQKLDYLYVQMRKYSSKIQLKKIQILI